MLGITMKTRCYDDPSHSLVRHSEMRDFVPSPAGRRIEHVFPKIPVSDQLLLRIHYRCGKYLGDGPVHAHVGPGVVPGGLLEGCFSHLGRVCIVKSHRGAKSRSSDLASLPQFIRNLMRQNHTSLSTKTKRRRMPPLNIVLLLCAGNTCRALPLPFRHNASRGL